MLDGGLAFVSRFLVMSVQCMCGAFSLSKNETMIRSQVHVHVELHVPAYVEIVQAIASYAVWLSNSMGVVKLCQLQPSK